MKIKFLFICLFSVISFTLFSQQDGIQTILDVNKIRTNIQNAKLAKNLPVDQSKAKISLPLTNGASQLFRVVESPILGETLSANFPEIKSYLIQGENDDRFHGRLSVSPFKVTAVFYSPDGITYIEPTAIGSDLYQVYHTDMAAKNFECGHDHDLHNNQFESIPINKSNLFSNGTLLRTYDMIIATTGEFYQANGNTNTAVTAEINTIMSGMNVFYENEVAIRFNIVSLNLLSNPATDGLNPSGNRTTDAQNVISAYASNNGINYDIGHVMHTTASGGSGVAGPAPCNANLNARGWSGFQQGASVFSWVSLMGHEIGHQFSAAHSYYGTEFNCQNRSPGNGYEPGSGSTVMSYEGICQSQNILPAPSTNYFHVHSLTQILNFAAGSGNCSTNTPTGNTIPAVTMPPTITIPRSTPFYLNASATDADDDALTYCWEQYDTDNVAHAPNSTAGIPANAAGVATRPLFRSFDPSPNGHERYFPQLSDIVSGTTTQGEILSTVARTITMRMTVRDNVINGGAFVYDEVPVTVVGTGPFTVSSPNGGENYAAGSAQTITWNVAGTNAYCSTVDVLLSIDGGFNYPYTLAANVNNDGSQSVTIPQGVTNSNIARIMIRCSDDPDAYFFDISNTDFTINSSCIAPSNVFTNNSPTTYNQGQTINLNVTPSFLGTTITGYTGSSFSFTSMGINDSAGNGCSTTNVNADLLQFTVDATGTYTISQNPFFCGFSIFDGVSTACNDFLASSLTATVNGVSVTSGSSSVTLVAGNTYTLAIGDYNFGGNSSTTVAFSGAGNVLTTGSLPSNYMYSYLVVDQATGLVVDVDAGANFTGLAGGVYDVIGFAYENDGSNSTAPPDVNPNTFIGQSIADILNGGSCVNFSNNTVTLTVIGNTNNNCPQNYTLSGFEGGTGGQNMDGDFETDGIITSTHVIVGGPVDYDAGTYIDLLPGFNLLTGFDFHAFIDGCGGAMLVAPENENDELDEGTDEENK